MCYSCGYYPCNCQGSGEVQIVYTGVAGADGTDGVDGSPYTALVFSAGPVAATANYFLAILPFDVEVVGVSVHPRSFGGTPTGFNVDINVDGVLQRNIVANDAGTATLWKSSALDGGSGDVIPANSSQTLSVDINFVGGSAPTVHVQVVIWYRMVD